MTHSELLILPCGAQKRAERSKACRLYTGPYFTAALEWALGTVLVPRARILILSAKHGLVGLDEEIEPYEQQMGRPGAVRPGFVWAQANARGLLQADPVLAIGGRPYLDVVRDVWPHALAPLEGLPIGEQIRRLRRQQLRLAAACGRGQT